MSRCEPTPLFDVANQSCQTSAMRSTSGRDVRTIRSSHQTWSWPHASYGASGRPFSSVGAWPTKCSRPGLVSALTAPCSPSFASFSASPLRGPKPARQSSRSASATSKLPLYAASCGNAPHWSASVAARTECNPRMRERPRVARPFPCCCLRCCSLFRSRFLGRAMLVLGARPAEDVERGRTALDALGHGSDRSADARPDPRGAALRGRGRLPSSCRLTTSRRLTSRRFPCGLAPRCRLACGLAPRRRLPCGLAPGRRLACGLAPRRRLPCGLAPCCRLPCGRLAPCCRLAGRLAASGGLAAGCRLACCRLAPCRRLAPGCRLPCCRAAPCRRLACCRLAPCRRLASRRLGCTAGTT